MASGQSIPNLGKRRCLVWTEGAARVKKINVQVADVHKGLLSLRRCTDRGFDVEGTMKALQSFSWADQCFLRQLMAVETLEQEEDQGAVLHSGRPSRICTRRRSATPQP